jgi:hypothetical protein
MRCRLSDIILRPVYDRAAFLHFSLDSEIRARNMVPNADLETVFIVDCPDPVKEISIMIEKFPFKKRIIKRPTRLGLENNVISGLLQFVPETDVVLFYVEDDVVLHDTYFKFIYDHNDIYSNPKTALMFPYLGGSGSGVCQCGLDRLSRPTYTAITPVFWKKFFCEHIKPVLDKMEWAQRDGFPSMTCPFCPNGDSELCVRCSPPQSGKINSDYLLADMLIDLGIDAGDYYSSRYHRAWHIGIVGQHIQDTAEVDKFKAMNLAEQMVWLKNNINSGDLWETAGLGDVFSGHAWSRKPQDIMPECGR